MALALDLEADTAQPVFRRQWSGVFSKILDGTDDFMVPKDQFPYDLF